MTQQKDALDKAVEKVADSDKGEDPEGKVKQLEGQVAQKIRKYKTETPETELHIKDDGVLCVAPLAQNELLLVVMYKPL